jgi:hypothetical protein
MQIQGSVAQASGRHSGDSNVNRLSLHMLAMFRHSRARAVEKFVAPRRAVAADNIDLGPGATQLCGEIAQQVEKPGIQGNDIACSVIS